MQISNIYIVFRLFLCYLDHQEDRGGFISRFDEEQRVEGREVRGFGAVVPPDLEVDTVAQWVF